MGLGFPLYMAVVLSAIPAELELPALVAYFTDWLLMFEVVIAVEASCFLDMLLFAASNFMFSNKKERTEALSHFYAAIKLPCFNKVSFNI